MKRKILSLLMIITMMISFVQLPIQAALVSGVTEKAKINLVALQEDSTTTGVIGKYGFKVVNPSTLKLDEAKEGDIFYIGVQVDDIMNIAEPADGYGVMNLSLAFNYDDTYVEVLEDFTETLGGTGWTLYMDMTMGQAYKIGTRDYYYYYHKNDDNVTYDFTTSAVDTSLNEVFLNISWENKEVEPTYVFPDEDIIAIIPIQFTADAPTTATELFSFSTDNNKYCLDFGLGAAAYQLPNGSTTESKPSESDTTDILHVVEYSKSGVNFFPQKYTVEFYPDEDNAKAESNAISKTLTVPENSSVTDISGTLPTESDFGFTDKYITGFKYLDTSNASQTFTADTDLVSTMFATGSTTLKVYPETQPGMEIAFYRNVDSSDTEKESVYLHPTDGGSVTALPTAIDSWTKTGYTRNGWADNADGSGTTYSDTEVLKDYDAAKTYYAKWEQDITINYSVDGTVTPGTATAYNTVYADPADPTPPEGKGFDGWYTTETTGGIKIAADNTKTYKDIYDEVVKSGITPTVAGTITLYARWTDKITVTFYPNQEGATSGTATKVYVTPGNSMDDDGETAPTFEWKSADGTATLYSFIEWNTESNGSGDSYTSEQIQEFTYKSSYADGETVPPQTLYAMWDASGDGDTTNDVTVQFDGNTTDTVDIDPASVKVNDGALLYAKDIDMEPQRTGYKFLGWSESPVVGATVIDFKGGASYKVNDNDTSTVTLYAHWEYEDTATAITVNFYHDANGDGDTDDDGETIGSIKVAPGETLSAAQLPGTGSLTIPDGFTLHDTNEWVTAEGEVFAAGIAIDGSKFSALTSGKTLTVKTNLMQKITVTYDVNGGDGTVAAQTGAYNATYTHPTTKPTMDGFAFTGWYTATDNTGIKISDADSTGKAKTYQDIWDEVNTAIGSATPGAVTLYAKWQAEMDVNFYPNFPDTTGDNSDPRGTPQIKATQPDVPYTGVIPAVPERTNYTFKGWDTASNGTGTRYDETLKDDSGNLPTFTSDFDSLYAIWEANTDDGIDNKTVTFKPGRSDADVSPETVTVNEGDSIYRKDITADPVADDTKYKFLGWYEGEAVNATRVDALSDDGSTAGYPVTEDTILYGHWEYIGTDAITVNFAEKDGTTIIGSITVAPTDTIAANQLPTAATVDNYTFDAWKSGSGIELVPDDPTSTATPSVIGTVFSSDITGTPKTLTLKATYTARLMVVAKPTSYDYKGADIDPTFDVYYMTDTTDESDQATWPTPFLTNVSVKDSTFAANFKVEIIGYTDESSTTPSTLPTTVRNAGDYALNVSFTDNSPLKADGAIIEVKKMNIEVKPIELDFTVDPATQKYKKNEAARANGITVALTTTLPGDDAGINANAFSVKYYKWTDSDGDKVVDDDATNKELVEIDTATNPLDTLDPARYMAKIVPTNNYVVNEVKSSDSSTAVIEWSSAEYPAGTTGKGNNLLFQIQAIDPFIESLAMKSVADADTTAGTSEVTTDITTLYADVAYTTTTTFNAAGKPDPADPTTDPTYYIRVTDVEADDLVLTLTLENPATTYVYYSDSTTPVNTLGANPVTVTVDLSSIDVTPTAVTITTKTDDGSADIVYTFVVQQLIAPTITLKPGNSPYGMIMSETGWDDTKKGLAKTEFDKGNKFVDGYKPAQGDLNMVYTTLAWTDDIEATSGPTDSETNMDRNDNALFLYQGDAFVDPGFTVVNSLGVLDTEAKPTISVEMDYMGESHGVDNIKDSAITKLTFSNASGAENDLSTIGSKYIRPGRYILKYSYTDTTSGSTTTEERYVVMLWTRGDANLSTVPNPTDSSFITQVIKAVEKPLDGVTGITRGIYYYRVVDVNMSGVVNPTDSSYATQMIKGAQSDARMYPAISK